MNFASGQGEQRARKSLPVSRRNLRFRRFRCLLRDSECSRLVTTVDASCYHPSEDILGRHALRRGWWIAVTLLAVVSFAIIALVLRSGSTDAWPETGCTVAGSRVIPADVADSSRAIVLYKGEYHLRYSVGRHDYFVWANSGWADPDREFVQSKIDYLPETCDFRVRYNPVRPSDALAVRR